MVSGTPIPSAIFANCLQSAFTSESSSSPFTEVGQFRALMRAFADLKPHFFLEEFHGFKRQVYFDTSHLWQRPRARCELCDVLLVVYSTRSGLDARMTLLQAKLSRQTHVTGLSASTGIIEPQEFKANLEQWSLLSARPPLIATTVFRPPSDLLSRALLPSVGTFGVFHRSTSGPVDLFYIAADCLTPASTPIQPDTRIWNLKTIVGSPVHRHSGSLVEVTYCPTLLEFARSLYKLSIGTPVVLTSHLTGRTKYQPHYDWVASVLAAHLSASGQNAPAARELMQELGTPQAMPDAGVVPSLVILRSDALPND
jgi:hypothetical protein